MQIILASQSPRRKELLTLMGLDFSVEPSNFDEHLDDNRTPEAVAEELALGKANEVAERYPNSLIIGSDTIVEVDGIQLEKPRDEEDAIRILTMLSNKPSYVITGIAVVCKNQGIKLVASDITKVLFKHNNRDAIFRYVSTGDPMDKAGAYGIQSGAASLIDHIEGNYDTVVGLPTRTLVKMLTEIGIVAKEATIECPVVQKL